MKKLIAPTLLLLTMNCWSQSSKSIEVSPSPRLPEVKKEQLEQKEEQRVRREWDQEEARAQEQEERQRRIDEERAEMDDLPQPIIVKPVNPQQQNQAQ